MPCRHSHLTDVCLNGLLSDKHFETVGLKLAKYKIYIEDDLILLQYNKISETISTGILEDLALNLFSMKF